MDSVILLEDQHFCDMGIRLGSRLKLLKGIQRLQRMGC